MKPTYKPEDLQAALDALALFDTMRGVLTGAEPHFAMPALYNVAVDEPYDDNDPDHHGPDAVYLVWLTLDGLRKLQEDSRGRMSYWPAGWYPSAESLLTTSGAATEHPIWEEED